MILKKSLIIASALSAIAVAVIGAGCSSSGIKAGDPGGKCLPNGTCNTGSTCDMASMLCSSAGEGGASDATSADAKKDTGTGMDGSMNMCPTPLDVSTYMPETLPPSTGKHQNKCDAQTLALYKKCVDGDMPSCMTINMGAMTTYKACLDCIFTSATDAAWGPAVCIDPMTCYLNIEGCYNLATGQMGAMSCGQLIHSSYGCQRAACETQCSGDAQGFSKCVQTALGLGCKKYGDPANACFTFSTDPDGGYPDLANCFRLQTEMDSKALEVRMVTYFCGQ
jgi:hypothetical protein